MPTSVLFLKDYRGFSGGHLKTWQYFEYLDEDPRFDPRVALTWRSARQGNPWTQLDSRYRVSRRAAADVLVVDGTEWRLVPRRRRTRPDRPVVNLVQGVRHAAPSDERFGYLRFPAIRVCVGPEVAEAIVATGRVAGPVVTIPAATDVTPERECGERPVDVFVAATKQRELGRRLAQRLAAPGRRLELQTELGPRAEFLDRLRAARVALLLPGRREGCYLPALEAMAVGAVVVCPDCIGNRSFCLDGVTCFRPDYEEDALVAATEAALAGGGELRALRERAWAVVRERSRERERERVIDLFEHVDELWAQVPDG